MTTVSRDLAPLLDSHVTPVELMVDLEWLVTNGLGGYASGTVAGALTRRYHGVLIAAYPAPLGRTMLLNCFSETLILDDGSEVRLGADCFAAGVAQLEGVHHVAAFRMDYGLPVWRYQSRGIEIEKRLVLPYRRNTAYLGFRLVSGAERVRLRLRPALHFRSHHEPVLRRPDLPYRFRELDQGWQVDLGDGAPHLRLALAGASFTSGERETAELFYPIEQERGYESVATLWSPGHLEIVLEQGREAVVVCSGEEWQELAAIDPAQAIEQERERRRQLVAAAAEPAQRGLPAELVVAADQFIITPPGRTRPEGALASEEISSMIAGYHWFTDWGRDTMISLEGLTLATGRHEEAGRILRSFASFVQDGLIPNLFPEETSEGLYHTADASLWFFHAVARYLEATGDRGTLEQILPKLQEIIDRHLAGTRFGIGVDPEDGLLRQGAPGYQLTWMDAKVEGWVVTPRRGKAVEINALWYNALRLMQGWVEQQGNPEVAGALDEWAERAYRSFNERFWYQEGGYLYDVIDGEQGLDSSCRPNQLFAFSLTNPILEQRRWQPVFDTVCQRLLTPYGLRTLAPGHPDYKICYDGDIRARDAAYHQGTVWPWLIGPFVDAWLRLDPAAKGQARAQLEQLAQAMNHQSIGTVGEIYDAEAPFLPRGCVAQAWSIAELLRCWLKTEP